MTQTQALFNRVWNHYVVEGRPFGVTSDFNVLSGKNTEKGINNSINPLFLFANDYEELAPSLKHVVLKLDSLHKNVAEEVLSETRAKKPHSRAARRLFRKYFKEDLFCFGSDYNIQIPSARANTRKAAKRAAVWKD